MEKTHDSTSASTIAELNNTIQRHQVTHMALPSNFESLYDGTGLYSKLQTDDYLNPVTAGGAGSDLDLANASLSKAGVKTVYNNNSSTTDATFQSTIGGPQTVDPAMFAGTDIPLVFLQGTPATDDQTFFGQLNSALVSSTDTLKNQLMYAFGGDQQSWDTNCTNYVVMGIGPTNTLIPTSMQSAPVVFGSNGDEAPAKVYERYVAVFAVPSANTLATGGCTSNGDFAVAPTADAAARFIGAAADMPFPALVGLNGAQQWANNNLNE
jgi:hypothetical protein